MKSEQQVYELDDIWEESWFSDHDRLRINSVTNEVLKLGIDSLLDVGCGNGMFLNHLKNTVPNEFSRLCGAERSKSAIKHVKTESKLCSIDELPFNDREFELVTCQEVIEHLPNNIYEKSIRELFRVSSRFVFISVPFNESLKDSLVECPKCITQFNPEYHMRSFDIDKLMEIESISGHKMIKHDFILTDEFAFTGLIKLVSGAKKTMPSYTICPMCGYNENQNLSHYSSQNESSLKSLLRKNWPKKKRKRWIYGIFEKD